MLSPLLTLILTILTWVAFLILIGQIFRGQPSSGQKTFFRKKYSYVERVELSPMSVFPILILPTVLLFSVVIPPLLKKAKLESRTLTLLVFLLMCLLSYHIFRRASEGDKK